MQLTIERFVNLVYYWRTRSLSSEDLTRFDNDLASPPRGSSASSQVDAAVGAWSREAELAEFQRARS